MSELLVGRWISSGQREPSKTAAYFVRGEASLVVQVYSAIGGWLDCDKPEEWLEPFFLDEDEAIVERALAAFDKATEWNPGDYTATVKQRNLTAMAAALRAAESAPGGG